MNCNSYRVFQDPKVEMNNWKNMEINKQSDNIFEGTAGNITVKDIAELIIP